MAACTKSQLRKRLHTSLKENDMAKLKYIVEFAVDDDKYKLDKESGEERAYPAKLVFKASVGRE
jgi:hypothetical protein